VVDVAVRPVLARLGGADERVSRLVEMGGGVPVRRVVAAADLPAAQAHPQVDPAAADLEALLAAEGRLRQLGHLDRIEVGTGVGHACTLPMSSGPRTRRTGVSTVAPPPHGRVRLPPVEGSSVRTAEPAALEQQLEQHRAELKAYCYRMLASPFEGEGAVRETFTRAGGGLDRFEGRSALRSWLYRIATNVCLDMLSSKERRARPMDLGPAREPVIDNLATPEVPWIEPIPDP